MTTLIKRLKYAVAVAALTCALPLGAQAQPAGDTDLTLFDAVRKGVLTNPEYGIVANDRRATDEELNQAKSLFYPSIDFLGNAGFDHSDTPTNEDETFFTNQSTLTLTQLLFDGYASKSEVKRQKARVKSTTSRVDETAEVIALDIVESFFEVLRQRDLLAISRANVQDHLRIMQTIQEGANAGTVTVGDVAQAEARLAQARATESSVREALRVGEARFRREVGDTPEKLIFPEIPREHLSADVEESVRRALANSPTLDIFEADIDVAAAETEATGATLYPQVDLEVQGTIGENLSGIEGEDKRASVLTVVNWNLYRGGGDRARQREFIYREAIAKETYADQARAIEQEIRDTWAGVVAANEQAQQFLLQAEANERVVQVYLDQFTLDRRTLLDVLDGQNELFVSRSSNVNALYTEIFGMYRLLSLQGRLLDVLGIQQPYDTNLKLENAGLRPIRDYPREGYIDTDANFAAYDEDDAIKRPSKWYWPFNN